MLCDDVKTRAPLTVSPDPDLEGQAVLVDPCRCRRRDGGRAAEGPSIVGKHQLAALHARGVLALLLERVLDLEQIREIAAGIDADAQFDRFGEMVENRELLVKTCADRALADHGQLRVDVDGPRTGHEEEARLEVLKVVDRERIQPLAVHGQHPSGEETRVEREQPCRIGRRCFDVAARVADHEGVAIEDPDKPVAHFSLPAEPAAGRCVRPPCGLGKSRWRRTSNLGSPRRPPRRAAPPPSSSARRREPGRTTSCRRAARSPRERSHATHGCPPS